MSLSPEEQLAIANSGGKFDETGSNSWLGKKIRKGKRNGKVIRDMNGMYRILTVEFEDGGVEEIKLNNIGVDPEYVHEYEWYCEYPGREGKWYSFGF